MEGFYIGEAAALVGVSRSTLRLWERHKLIVPHRSPSGYRVYTDNDIVMLRTIYRLIHIEGLNLAGVRKVLKMPTEEPPESVRSSQERLGMSMGPKLRRLREERGLSLAEVSNATGLSVPWLSQVERSKAHLSIDSLWKLAKFYDRNLIYFFERLGEEGKNLVHPEDRRPLDTTSGDGVRMELLTDLPSAVMEPILFFIRPGGERSDFYAHEGEEFLFMLKGALDFWIGEAEVYRLHEGDCLYFDSVIKHRYRNPSDSEVAIVLWVNTPPTF
jgi:DNA-binding transcriptional MerR regulator/quercetin dioxygenase-like cupin family protein